MIKITMIILYIHPSADPPLPAPERERVCRLLAALQGTADPPSPHLTGTTINYTKRAQTVKKQTILVDGIYHIFIPELF